MEGPFRNIGRVGCFPLELFSPKPLIVKVTADAFPNGHYLSCDTCEDGQATATVLNGTGAVEFVWVEVPEEFRDSRLEGASLFQRFGDGEVDVAELFGPTPFAIGTGPQRSDLRAEQMYAAFALDEVGCSGGEGFMLERPKTMNASMDSLRARHIRVERISSYTEGDSLLFFGDSTIIFNHLNEHIYAMRRAGSRNLRIQGATPFFGRSCLQSHASQ